MATGLVVGLILVGLSWRWLSRGRKARAARALPNPGPPDLSPRGRLVAHSDAIRATLTSQFGTAWRAKTTEELSAEPQLAEVLGPDPLQDLIRFLDQVDQLKFAPERSSHHHESLVNELAAWEPRLADLKGKIAARVPARS